MSRWRIQLLRQDGSVQSEAVFRNEAAAGLWWRSIVRNRASGTLPSGVASFRVQVRAQGEARYHDTDELPAVIR